MKRRTAAAVALALLAAACSRPSTQVDAKAAAKADGQTRDQVLAYLDHHPEVINEAAQRYEMKKRAEAMVVSTKAIAAHRDALEHDPRDFVANPAGKITVVEFFDYRCPYCKASQPALQQLIRDNPDIRFVFKEMPILPDADGQVGVSLRASEAALAAARQGKYLQVHNALMAAKPLDDAGVAKALKDAGLDPAKTVATADDEHHLKEVRDLALAIGSSGTPTFVVGGTMVEGSRLDELAAAIQDARKDARG